MDVYKDIRVHPRFHQILTKAVKVATMKLKTIKEFTDKATSLIQDDEPILITRLGRPAGLFIPLSGAALPLDLRKELIHSLGESIKTSLEKQGLKEEDILEDFEKFRKRKARRRR
jgi:hypothetical protein